MTARLVGPGGSVTVTGEVEVKNDSGARIPMKDNYLGGEFLPDQVGVGGVLDFDFTTPVDLVWVRCDGGDGRADPFGGVPAAGLGIFCEDGLPTPLTVTTAAVAVFASVGMTVHVHGYRY